MVRRFRYAGDHGIALHVLIDEHDSSASTGLAHRGAAAYRSFTHGGGFYRGFFATLKAGAAGARNLSGRIRPRSGYGGKPIARSRSGLASHSARSIAVSASGSCRQSRISAFLRTTATSPGVRAVRATSSTRGV